MHPGNDTVRILAYSHDTYGLGHLTRTLRVAAAIQERFRNASTLIMTGSPVASHMPLPASTDLVKLPSVVKTAAEVYRARDLEIGFFRIRKLRQNIIRSTAEAFRPHLLIVDNVPLGMKGELVPTLRALKDGRQDTRVALNLRDILDAPEQVRPVWDRDGVAGVLEEIYDRIFVLGDRGVYDAQTAYALPPDKTRFLGYAAPSPRRRHRRSPRGASGAHVLFTVGGGGDGAALLRAALDAPSVRRLALPAQNGGNGHRHVEFVTGPLMDPAERAELGGLARERGIALHEFVRDLPERMERADLVVAMGGYNTCCEILSRARRALIVPRNRPRVEQLLRAQAFESRGLVRFLDADEMTPASLSEAIERALEVGPLIDAERLPLMDGLSSLATEIGHLRPELRLREAPGGSESEPARSLNPATHPGDETMARNRTTPARRTGSPSARAGAHFSAGAPLLALLLAVAAPARGALDAGPWPMFHRDLRHSAFCQLALPVSGALAWNSALSDTVEFSSPVLSSTGVIYIGDQGKDLWAFNPDGTPRWHYHTLGNLRYSTPAVSADGTIYIGSADGKLYAVWNNGTLRWTYSAGGPVKTSPAIGADGAIYFGSDDAKLYAINPNGTLRWSYATGDTIRSSPAIGSDGAIYFGSYDGYIYALNSDGTLRWRGATGGRIRDCAPAIGQGDVIVIGSTDGFLYSIRPDGSLNWAAYTGNQLRSSPAIGFTGKIYLGIDTKIVCYRDNGNESWSFDTGARVLSSPAVTMGADSVDVVVCGSDSDSLYCVRLGSLQWKVGAGDNVRCSPSIGPGSHVYFASMNGRIFCVGPPVPSSAPPISVAGGDRLACGPNPARPGETIWFRRSAPVSGAANEEIQLRLHDAAGRAVRSLPVDPSGSALWDGRDASGRPAPAGTYFYTLVPAEDGAAGRLVLIR